MNGSQIGLAAGFAVILLIIVIGLRGSTRVRQITTRTSGDPATTPMVDSSGADCDSSDGGGSDGGGCD